MIQSIRVTLRLELLWLYFWHWSTVITDCTGISVANATALKVAQCYLSQLDHRDAVLSGIPFYLISTNEWAQKRIFLVSSDSGRCSNDHCAYNILQNKENTFITRIPYVRINETYNQSVNNDFQSHGTKKSKYKSWTISKANSKSTEKTRFVLTADMIIHSG